MENVNTDLRAFQRVELMNEIKGVMALKGMSVADLAVKLGTGEKRLQRVLDGRFSEKLSVYLDICEAVGCRLGVMVD